MTIWRKVVKLLLAVASSLLMIVRWPVIAATMAAVPIGSFVDKHFKDPYVKALLCCAGGVLFFLLLFNVGELAWVLVAAACYAALDGWDRRYLAYAKA